MQCAERCVLLPFKQVFCCGSEFSVFAVGPSALLLGKPVHLGALCGLHPGQLTRR